MEININNHDKKILRKLARHQLELSHKESNIEKNLSGIDTML